MNILIDVNFCHGSLHASLKCVRIKLSNAQQAMVEIFIRGLARKIIESFICNPNDVVANKSCPFPRPILGVLEATFPFHHRPTAKTVLGQFTENAFEIYLPIAGATVPACPVEPALVAAKSTLLARGMELRILYMKCFNAGMVMIDIGQVIQLL